MAGDKKASDAKKIFTVEAAKENTSEAASDCKPEGEEPCDQLDLYMAILGPQPTHRR